ncbi:hypothetical protein GGP41_008662 [Bipolaris sorokiniana]|uniref:Uncharacterized protein n=1 Tax=Cochliobolus sativus TaxID=45130 RepID=A0A8H6DSJ3_COCSA|nr:hypothetical protein GGP41_008662 [Bipolaris sorokiniana]
MKAKEQAKATSMFRDLSRFGAIHEYCAESDMSDAAGPVGMLINKDADSAKGEQEQACRCMVQDIFNEPFSNSRCTCPSGEGSLQN